ncbi:hypothetical protein [Rhodoferax sp.]|uniref:hypothetical protein n=1 Tax=Rhodoferax sp. TaxID=50421 RepID=UPI002733696F|nr:hypothetical protein [Rhodoferax sp.]MDP3190277.1 hypothetical protein [Rhodoferax sp.]
MAKSRAKLGELRHATETHPALQNLNLSVFAAGSLGRLEVGDKSDFDVFMLADNAEDRRPSITRLEEFEVFAALIQINENLKYPRFSGDGRFLKTYELKDMIKSTGSPRDDSENLFTARILLLLESQPITNSALYKRAEREVVENYFRDGKGRDDFRPLFVMNDILRYWRTLCLNYEEHRTEVGRPWLKKNLNLKFSRKLTNFSTIAALLAGVASSPKSFIEVCELTPIERLAFALDEIDDPALVKPFEKALEDYELFLKAKEASSMHLGENDRQRRIISEAADRFGKFLNLIIDSNRIDWQLRRYVLI